MPERSEKFCTRCGTVGVPASDEPNPLYYIAPLAGAVAISALLRARGARMWWFPAAIAGVRVAGSAARRRATAKQRCTACGSDHVIPLDTPFARERMRNVGGSVS